MTVTIDLPDAITGHALEEIYRARIKENEVSYITGALQVERRMGKPEVVEFLSSELTKMKKRLYEE